MKKLLGAILAFLLLSTSAFAVVSSTNSKDIFQGDGSTVAWQYDFPIILTSDIEIFTIDSSGNVTPVTTNYSINTSTATVTYPVSGTPLPIGSQIVLQRVEPLTQATSLKNQYRLPLDVIETSLDKLTLITQQLQTSLNQTIQQAINSTTPITLPGYVSGNLLAWGSTPGSIINVANPSAVAQWSLSGLNISYNAGNVSTTQNFSANNITSSGIYNGNINWPKVQNLITHSNVNWNDFNMNGLLNSGGVNWNDVNFRKVLNSGGVNWNDINLHALLNHGAVNWTDINTFPSITGGGVTALAGVPNTGSYSKNTLYQASTDGNAYANVSGIADNIACEMGPSTPSITVTQFVAPSLTSSTFFGNCSMFVPKGYFWEVTESGGNTTNVTWVSSGS